MNVAEIAEALDGFGKIGGQCDDDVKIDYGLRGKARHGGAADMFDADCETTKSGHRARGQLRKDIRPGGIVVFDQHCVVVFHLSGEASTGSTAEVAAQRAVIFRA